MLSLFKQLFIVLLYLYIYFLLIRDLTLFGFSLDLSDPSFRSDFFVS